MTPTFVAALALFALAVPLSAQSADSRPKVPAITVSGSGEVHVDPDLAVVRLGVLAQNAEASMAQQEANRVAKGILDGVEALGVPRDAVQTSRLVLSPVYEQPRPQDQAREPRISAYRASNVVSVRLDDLTKIGPVIDAAVEAGANQVEGVEFQLENDTAARQQALTRAVQEARAKAAAIADALDVALGPVLEATEGGVSVQVPQFGGGPRMLSMQARAPEPTPVSTGEITVSASVTLRYRING